MDKQQASRGVKKQKASMLQWRRPPEAKEKKEDQGHPLGRHQMGRHHGQPMAATSGLRQGEAEREVGKAAKVEAFEGTELPVRVKSTGRNV